jgi:hypothetical protein
MTVKDLDIPIRDKEERPTVTMSDEWIQVDLEGFGQLMASRPKVSIVYDLLQNVFDEDASTATVILQSIDGSLARLIVEDDSPDGFHDLSDAYTLYQPSKKKGDPTKRGRFNEGEKYVLSQCESAKISTTTGTVHFTAEGRLVTDKYGRTEGSIFDAIVRLTPREVSEILADLERVLIPEGITVSINGRVIDSVTPVEEIELILPTVTSEGDQNGVMRPTRRKTTVQIMHVQFDEQKPHLYEMGIPVVEVDTPWNINIQQKVPLNRDRDNVTEGYKKVLLPAVLEATCDLLTEHEIAEAWVTEAVAHTDEETVKNIMDIRHGEGWVIGSPRDREADKNAIAHGKQVVNGGTYSKAVWNAIKEHKVANPSSEKYSLKPEISDGDPYEHAKSTKLTTAVQAYVKKAAMYLLDEDHFEVNILDDKRWTDAVARYGTRRIDFNWLALRTSGCLKLDAKAFGLMLDNLIIHECAHKFAGDHLSRAYWEACTMLGAKFRNHPTKWKLDPMEKR